MRDRVVNKNVFLKCTKVNGKRRKVNILELFFFKKETLYGLVIEINHLS